jgi:hypothetical protein
MPNFLFPEPCSQTLFLTWASDAKFPVPQTLFLLHGTHWLPMLPQCLAIVQDLAFGVRG